MLVWAWNICCTADSSQPLHSPGQPASSPLISYLDQDNRLLTYPCFCPQHSPALPHLCSARWAGWSLQRQVREYASCFTGLPLMVSISLKVKAKICEMAWETLGVRSPSNTYDHLPPKALASLSFHEPHACLPWALGLFPWPGLLVSLITFVAHSFPPSILCSKVTISV